MQAPCPSCGAEVQTEVGELAACSACGHWWIAEEPPPEDLTLDHTEEVDDAPPPPAPPPDIAPVELEPVAASAPGAVVAAMERARDLPAVVAPPTATPPDHPWEFELQFAVGDQVQGPWDRMHLREQLYQGRLTGDERIRVPGAGDWQRLGDRPEFAEILRLLGKDEPKVVGQKRIAGWKKGGGAPAASAAAAPPGAPSAAPEAPAHGPGPERAPPMKPAKGGPKVAVIGGAVVLVVVVLGVVAFFALG